jgi:hypothetical protein
MPWAGETICEVSMRNGTATGSVLAVCVIGARRSGPGGERFACDLPERGHPFSAVRTLGSARREGRGPEMPACRNVNLLMVQCNMNGLKAFECSWGMERLMRHLQSHLLIHMEFS